MWHFDTDFLLFHMPDIPEPELLTFLPSSSPAFPQSAAAKARGSAAADKAADGHGHDENKTCGAGGGTDGNAHDGSRTLTAGERRQQRAEGLRRDRDVGDEEQRGAVADLRRLRESLLPQTIDAFFSAVESKQKGLDPPVCSPSAASVAEGGGVAGSVGSCGQEAQTEEAEGRAGRIGGEDRYDVPSHGRSHCFVDVDSDARAEMLELDAGGLSYLWLRRHQTASNDGPSRMADSISDGPLLSLYQLPWPGVTATPAVADAFFTGDGGGSTRRGGDMGHVELATGGLHPHNYTLAALDRARFISAARLRTARKRDAGGGSGNAFGTRDVGQGPSDRAAGPLDRGPSAQYSHDEALVQAMLRDEDVPYESLSRHARSGACAVGLGCDFHVFFDRPRLLRSGVMHMYVGHPASDMLWHREDSNFTRDSNRDTGRRWDRSQETGSSRPASEPGRGPEGKSQNDKEVLVCWLKNVIDIATYACGSLDYASEDGVGGGAKAGEGSWGGLLGATLAESAKTGRTESDQLSHAKARLLSLCREMSEIKQLVDHGIPDVSFRVSGMEGFIHDRCGAGLCHCQGRASCVRENEVDSMRGVRARQDFTFVLLQILYGEECVDCDVRAYLLERGLVFRSYL